MQPSSAISDLIAFHDPTLLHFVMSSTNSSAGHSSPSSVTLSMPCKSCALDLFPSPSSSISVPLVPTPQEKQLPAIPISSASHKNSHSMITCGKTGISKSKHYSYVYQIPSSPLLSSLLVMKEPKGFKSAAKSPEWLVAMKEEIRALKLNQTWELVPRPLAINVVGSKCVFRTKYHLDGSIDRLKARLVAKGYTQLYGLDFNDTFSPVVRASTVRIVLSITVSRGWNMRQLDVKNAFLHGLLQEQVYMEQPSGYADSSHPNHVCHLKKAIYSLKQTPRAWFHRFSHFSLTVGFNSSQADSSLFVYSSAHEIIYLLLYVDDIIIIGNNMSLTDSFIRKLRHEFSMKDLGILNYFLGLEVTYSANGIFLSQLKYTRDLLLRADLLDSKPVGTPMIVSQHLTTNGNPFHCPTTYRSLVGALQYLTLIIVYNSLYSL